MAQPTIVAFGDSPWIMGVVNVTPDSFSDGGRYQATDAAIARGLTLWEQGARIIDIGGESTRPGAHRIDAATEIERVLPVVRELTAAGVRVSVDTTRSAVAAAALEAGAALINDVSGGLVDAQMAAVMADARVPWVLMHWRGPSAEMYRLAHYDDVVAEVHDELIARVEAAVSAGVDPRRLIIDPGIGFAKTAAHNWQVLAGLDTLVATGLPVLVGASRKRFLGELLADPAGRPRPAREREVATAAISLLAAERGVWGVRVHEVVPSRDAFATLDAMTTGAVHPASVPGEPLVASLEHSHV